MWNPFAKPKQIQVPMILPNAEEKALIFQTPTTSVPPQHVIFKRLKWVRVRGRTGIIWELDTSGYANVHFTNSAGETTDTQRVPCGELRLATYEEIPGPRRGDRAVAATLGYI